jgi:cytochrome P450
MRSGSRATHNTITSIFWLVVDIFQDPRVLHHIREEVESCLLVNGSDDIPPVFDMNRLQQQPYVQAAYAEILRLRTHGTILRKPRDNIVINDWFMPKDSLIATCSTTAHMNAAVWSSPERGSRPVFEFYPDRFLAHDPDRAEPQFTMAGTDGAWIPFAGGVRTCPGRHFAKYEIILTLAVLMKMYDIEILVKPGSANLQMSSYRFGLGVLEPKGKVPFRIRSR